MTYVCHEPKGLCHLEKYHLKHLLEKLNFSYHSPAEIKDISGKSVRIVGGRTRSSQVLIRGTLTLGTLNDLAENLTTVFIA